MYDPEEELLDRIRLGEDTFFEFTEVRIAGKKVKAPGRDNLADELASFANSRGGICLLGVRDDREVLGVPLESLDVLEDFVQQICVDSINPPIAPIIARHWMHDGAGERVAVLKIEVSRSLFVHQSPSGYVHRVGSSKRPMAPEALARLFQQRSQTRLIRFDEQCVASAALSDLDGDLWRRFSGTGLKGRDDDVLVKLGLARTDDDGTVRPTVAGVLMASKDPRRWLPNAFVQAVAYRGTTVAAPGDKLYQLDAQDIAGPLDRQILDACAFVKKNMRVAAFKDMGRVDLPQYDLTAVFEAVVNAVAHRDFSLHGSKVRLRMFADRLELYSPGAIANTMTVETLPYRQSARNEAVAGLLARCPIEMDDLATHRTHMMDRRGEGVPVILERSTALSGIEPRYVLLDDAELQLTIWAASPEASEQ